jgi:SAM-dependent methyltransferase
MDTHLVKRVVRAGADLVDLYLYWHTKTLREVAPRLHGKLLDVGCGDRRLEPLFAPHVESIVGIEYEPVFSSTDASTRAGKPDLYYDGKTLPFCEGTFDSVVSTEVLEHGPEPAALVAEMARVLKRGGTLLLTVPFGFRLHEEPFDYYRFTPYSLRWMVERCGLRVVEARGYGGVWSVVGHKINTHLALRFARLQAVGQALGKGAQDPSSRAKPRLWAIPMVAPALAGTTVLARALDRVAPDPTDALGFVLVAERPA